jgi:ubiquinone/menaquinone biosynthesis C-methylase UbiE
MGLLQLERVPEPEVMDDPNEVKSYGLAAAQRHLELIDSSFVRHLLRLLPHGGPSPDRTVWGLDIGTGPGQIPVMLLLKIPWMKIVAVDRSVNMLQCARRNARRAGVSSRLVLIRADANQLPFPIGCFDFGLCNSVLHHARDPVKLLRELDRSVPPEGGILLRDLRRPARPWFRYHLWRHGHSYSGLMRKLFDDSVRASYTAAELERLFAQSGISRARVFRFQGAHIGIERTFAG